MLARRLGAPAGNTCVEVGRVLWDHDRNAITYLGVQDADSATRFSVSIKFAKPDPPDLAGLTWTELERHPRRNDSPRFHLRQELLRAVPVGEECRAQGEYKGAYFFTTPLIDPTLRGWLHAEATRLGFPRMEARPVEAPPGANPVAVQIGAVLWDRGPDAITYVGLQYEDGKDPLPVAIKYSKPDPLKLAGLTWTELEGHERKADSHRYRLRSEMRRLRALGDAISQVWVIGVRAEGTPDGAYFFTTRLLDLTLQGWLRAEAARLGSHPPELEIRLQRCLELGELLAHLHAYRGATSDPRRPADRRVLVWGDHKPSNVGVESEDGGRMHLRILDVGTLVESGEATRSEGPRMGTRGHAPPGQWIPNSPEFAYFDEWALAVTMLQLLTGRTPSLTTLSYQLRENVPGPDHDPRDVNAFFDLKGLRDFIAEDLKGLHAAVAAGVPLARARLLPPSERNEADDHRRARELADRIVQTLTDGLEPQATRRGPWLTCLIDVSIKPRRGHLVDWIRYLREPVRPTPPMSRSEPWTLSTEQLAAFVLAMVVVALIIALS